MRHLEACWWQQRESLRLVKERSKVPRPHHESRCLLLHREMNIQCQWCLWFRSRKYGKSLAHLCPAKRWAILCMMWCECDKACTTLFRAFNFVFVSDRVEQWDRSFDEIACPSSQDRIHSSLVIWQQHIWQTDLDLWFLNFSKQSYAESLWNFANK